MATPNRFLKMVFFFLNKKRASPFSGKHIIAKNIGSTVGFKPIYYAINLNVESLIKDFSEFVIYLFHMYF